MSTPVDTTTASSSANAPPVRVNSFFTHLNLDVRCMIYDLLELPPVGNTNLGLVLSCKQAYAETETSAVRNFNRLLKKTEAEVAELETNKAKHEKARVRVTTLGARLEVSRYPLTSKFSDLRNLTIGVSWPILAKPLLIGKLLECHLTKLTLVALGSQRVGWNGTSNSYGLKTMEGHDFVAELDKFLTDLSMPKYRRAGARGNVARKPFRFTDYKAKHIELIWGSPTTENTTDMVHPIHFGFQNRTAKEKAQGLKFATMTGCICHERGFFLLEYNGPWEKVFDERSYQQIDWHWKKVIKEVIGPMEDE